ncbi:MAG: PQQ-binding-like beta-propeller repeat protein, partial [Bryobacteraceae bacterium]
LASIQRGGKMTRMAFSLIVAMASSLFGETAQWPQYRGPGASGIAERAAPLTFGPKQNVLWSAPLQSGHSSPSIWGDHLFLTSFEKNTKKLELVAYDRRNGKLRWSQTIPATELENVHGVSSPATATPVVDGERIYVYFGSAGLFCYDFSGKPIWSRPMPAAKLSFGSGVSPLLAGNALVLALDYGDRKLLAVDRASGKTLWEVKLGGSSGFDGHATPALWNGQIVLHRPGEVAAYDARDGARRWSVPIASQGTGTPVVRGDTLFVGAWGSDPDLLDPIPDWNTLLSKYDKDGSGTVSKEEFPEDLAWARRIDAGKTPGAVVTFKRFFGFLDPNKDSEISREEWEAVLKSVREPGKQPHGLLAIRIEEGKYAARVVWAEERAVPEVPVPLAYRGRIYAVTNGGIVTVLDEASGKLVYRGRLGASGMYYSSPVAAGDHLYFASSEGVVTSVRVGDKLDVVSRNELGEPVFATPAIVEGTLYIRTAGRLYAFGTTPSITR